MSATKRPASDPGRLATRLLLGIRHADTEVIEGGRAALAALTDDDLRAGVPDDRARLAFWIDVYNAAVLQQPPDATATRSGRLRLFRRPVIEVAGRRLSLDAIEHGVLRRSSWKLGLGYAHNPMPSAFERAHRVDRIDPRIHFALNCGAASCPPIAAYEADRVDEQLDRATRAALAADVIETDVLRLPTVMLWFIGDFGGRSGIRRFLARYDIDAEGRSLRFRRYDWSPAPGRWSTDA